MVVVGVGLVEMKLLLEVRKKWWGGFRLYANWGPVLMETQSIHKAAASREIKV